MQKRRKITIIGVFDVYSWAAFGNQIVSFDLAYYFAHLCNVKIISESETTFKYQFQGRTYSEIEIRDICAAVLRGNQPPLIIQNLFLKILPIFPDQLADISLSLVGPPGPPGVSKPGKPGTPGPPGAPGLT